jgi:hypothetical protein
MINQQQTIALHEQDAAKFDFAYTAISDIVKAVGKTTIGKKCANNRNKKRKLATLAL